MTQEISKWKEAILSSLKYHGVEIVPSVTEGTNFCNMVWGWGWNCVEIWIRRTSKPEGLEAVGVVNTPLKPRKRLPFSHGAIPDGVLTSLHLIQQKLGAECNDR